MDRRALVNLHRRKVVSLTGASTRYKDGYKRCFLFGFQYPKYGARRLVITPVINISILSLLTTLKQRARQLKSEAQVLILAYKDHRTPAAAKILIGITAGYFLSPIDLIPDLIPILGLLDDFFIVPALTALSIKLLPETVLQEARDHLKNNPGLP